MPAYETYGENPTSVIMISRQTDLQSVTVIGPFDDERRCPEWADAYGSGILTPGLHMARVYKVIQPNAASRILTGRYVGNAQKEDGLFRAGYGVVTPDGERPDGVPTVAVTRVSTRGDVVTAAVGIFASSQDARVWVNLLDSYYPRRAIGENTVLRSVLTPEQFADKVDEFRLKGQVV